MKPPSGLGKTSQETNPINHNGSKSGMLEWQGQTITAGIPARKVGYSREANAFRQNQFSYVPEDCNTSAKIEPPKPVGKTSAISKR